MKFKLCILVLALSLTSCGAAGLIVHTVTDIATALCEEAAAENVQALGGISVQKWCTIEENIAPFIDAVVMSKQKASEKAGLKKTQPQDAGE